MKALYALTLLAALSQMIACACQNPAGESADEPPPKAAATTLAGELKATLEGGDLSKLEALYHSKELFLASSAQQSFDEKRAETCGDGEEIQSVELNEGGIYLITNAYRIDLNLLCANKKQFTMTFQTRMEDKNLKISNYQFK